ncbi:hypothetical protein QTN25_006089 [Entamoeba marina]
MNKPSPLKRARAYHDFSLFNGKVEKNEQLNDDYNNDYNEEETESFVFATKIPECEVPRENIQSTTTTEDSVDIFPMSF